ncbi:MAG: hypothetical protein NTV07_04750 [Candidatus Omnitrophica bacterium]|nr:hypothetical protein [Candidatus Omnitrophota bacterium]
MVENNKKDAVKPIYVKLLLAAIVLYIISSCFMQADSYRRVCILEHKLFHVTCGYIR